MRIMNEDGPAPMRNSRPSKKTRNAADQFYDDHHRAYEERGQSKRDIMGQVNAHNRAYPKMYDEVDKRRSTAQQAAFSSNERILVGRERFDSNCTMCMKLKKKTEIDQRKKRRIRKSDQEKFNKLDRNLRTKKHQIRHRSISKIYKPKIWSNKYSQCTTYYVPTETKNVSISTLHLNDNFLSVQKMKPRKVAPSNENCSLKSKSVEQGVGKKPPSKSGSEKPGSVKTVASVTTYNSFMSMEHEPMVE